MVPVVWDGFSKGDFLCDAPEKQRCTIMPGIEPSGARASKVIMCNETLLDQIIEPGDVLAELVEVPEGMELTRRARHPATGAMPEVVGERDGR